MTTHLSVSDLIAAGSLTEAVDRMQSLVRISPEAPVDAAAVHARYMETREHLKAVVPPAPLRITVEKVRAR